MNLFCNGDDVGAAESVEWKGGRSDEGKVTFMVPFDFDWEGKSNAFLELVDPQEDDRVMIAQIQRVDEGAAGDFVVARYKALG